MSDGLIDFISADLAASNDQLGEDGKDGKTYLVELAKQYTGDYDGHTVRLKKGHRLAVKTFKKKKSINKRDFISIFFLKNKNKLEKKLRIKRIYKNIFSIKIIPEILKFKD